MVNNIFSIRNHSFKCFLTRIISGLKDFLSLKNCIVQLKRKDMLSKLNSSTGSNCLFVLCIPVITIQKILSLWQQVSGRRIHFKYLPTFNAQFQPHSSLLLPRGIIICKFRAIISHNEINISEIQYFHCVRVC